MRAIRIARPARRRHRLEPPVIRADGRLDARDAGAARRIAARLTESRGVSEAPPVSAGEVTALAVLDTILHRLVERETAAGRANLAAAAAAARRRVGAAAVSEVGRAWRRDFGDGAGERSPAGPRLMAELLVLAALNDNPAAGGVRELVDDRPLREASRYEPVIDAAEAELGGRAPRVAEAAGGVRTAAGRLPLPAQLRAPMVHAPGSLLDQLRWIREQWADLVAGDAALFERLNLALDVLAEEARGLELRNRHFGGPLPVEAPDYSGLDPEHDAFSADTEWMPRVVLVAKSTYVWLEQLARRFERPVTNLADVPDEELDRLAGLGVTGLWLIGLWQRSRASAEIKRRRGDGDAVASAYAIDEYRIADDLGGEAAFEALKSRAWARNIRIAADMVPNHMGLDSRWVIEHPEWFVSLPEPPYPAYSFGGPDLSDDPGVEITLEDHYWDASDAAVVFRRRGRHSGAQRFIYHGNDGTSFAWNDTAQLDYLRADVREAVIQTILGVARRSPIIRFDAAMVLARRHIRRLWYPAPGEGGAIPSRAEHALSQAEFNRRMPREFWREVVDRVAAEAPGTLLLAEAFWLMEGYFVRTLGMHRVYNSAFMHMLRDEDNAGYRKVMRDTLEFDPRVLQRFVNFMTNPDERPAAEQYGTGAKAFSVATLLATLPGLPMLGHGQVEGWRERYGHEFRRARWDEPVDEGHAGHFEWAIVPLLRRRAAFSGTERFRLYDAIAGDGSTVEDVYAFSNGAGADRNLVLVHHRYAETDARIDRSVGFADQAAGRRLRHDRLADALELPDDDEALVRFADPRSGWELVRTAGELRREGLRVHLGPYEARVLFVEAPYVPPPAEAAPRDAERVVVVARHRPPRRRPVRLRPGDAVRVGRRNAMWPAFVMVRFGRAVGWVPSRHLEERRGKQAVVRHGYDTTELAVDPGDELEVVERDDESGWLWCRSRDGRGGWVPIRSVVEAA
ncbi:MAG TPA: alpha-amylase family glycosyl hydrolase [Candidatus Deferrimicrobiaceae bacterium]|nr:alpha-amylase family glycosyl hydrolase [Candidatus Deferrimicrobiaceae bacterium]